MRKVLSHFLIFVWFFLKDAFSDNNFPKFHCWNVCFWIYWHSLHILPSRYNPCQIQSKFFGSFLFHHFATLSFIIAQHWEHIDYGINWELRDSKWKIKWKRLYKNAKNSFEKSVKPLAQLCWQANDNIVIQSENLGSCRWKSDVKRCRSPPPAQPLVQPSPTQPPASPLLRWWTLRQPNRYENKQTQTKNIITAHILWHCLLWLQENQCKRQNTNESLTRL